MENLQKLSFYNNQIPYSFPSKNSLVAFSELLRSGPKVIELFFMLNLAEHEMLIANRTDITNMRGILEVSIT